MGILNKMKISVMIPVYDRIQFIGRCLDSVLLATRACGSVEITVVDNCSPGDGVGLLIKTYASRGVGYVRNISNLGMFGNWNQCVALAAGDWVHILHDDDEVTPNFYSVAIDLIEANPSVGMLVAGCEFIDNNSRITGSVNQLIGVSRAELLDRMSRSNLCLPPCVLVKKEIYQRLGGFNPKYSFVCDWEMWLRVMTAADMVTSDLFWARYRIGISSRTFAFIVGGSPARETYSFSFQVCCNVLKLPIEQSKQIARSAVYELSYWHCWQLFNSFELLLVFKFWTSLVPIIGLRRSLMLVFFATSALIRALAKKLLK